METMTLKETLSARTVEGKLYGILSNNRVQCHACAHRCRIPDGGEGVCKVRFNQNGRLRVPWGYVGSLDIDPMEKKPFFHALPGARAFSFGMLGCDFHCDFCQNWFTSQALRDPASEEAGAFPYDRTAEGLVEMAVEGHCEALISTYNEPLITSEWAVEIFKKARQKGLLTGFVSNGNATREALEFLRPWVDLYKVDLKAFNDHTYRHTMGGTLAPILETVERLKEMGFWVEVVTLVVPGLNDSEKELRDIARFIASVSRDIPWHVTAFHPDYKLVERLETGLDSLNLAHQIGRAAGLHFVYSGNRLSKIGTTENTYCPSCGTALIERYGFQVLRNQLTPDGACPRCSTPIPGVWKVPGRDPWPVAVVEHTPKAAEGVMRSKEPEEALAGET